MIASRRSAVGRPVNLEAGVDEAETALCSCGKARAVGVTCLLGSTMPDSRIGEGFEDQAAGPNGFLQTRRSVPEEVSGSVRREVKTKDVQALAKGRQKTRKGDDRKGKERTRPRDVLLHSNSTGSTETRDGTSLPNGDGKEREGGRR
jgi:hypothetical protein